MARTTPVVCYCRKPVHQPAGPHLSLRLTSTSLVYHARLTHALTNPKPYLDSNAQSTPYAAPPLFEHPSTTINLMISESLEARFKSKLEHHLGCWIFENYTRLANLEFLRIGKGNLVGKFDTHTSILGWMRRGGDKLHVAANGASIGAPDQKLSRPEAADE
ncbi:hypothetical protein PIB30_054694 [Stylosanthes scabra]|uniref:Uncharacterized protein n=1 Tax=Stylosanthes scabra TaxID=79078 RepID=A0ABU6VH14_9FABA|nr:hypothetical protein [Stylosanthes scabra]